MDRARSQLDTLGYIQKQIRDLYSQLGTVRNQNLALPDWIAIGATHAPAFQNSWVNFGAPQDGAAFWRSSSGIVIMRGSIKSGTAASAFTLPQGFRPGGIRRFPVVTNAVFGYVTVNTDGTVVMTSVNNTFVDLASITFRAEL